MLRGGARAEAWPRTLVGSMWLPRQARTRWLIYVDSGHATLSGGAEPSLDLGPGDAALTVDASGLRGLLRGTGEIILVKLYA
jgi:hypothetical protein